jgi:hypothetical protein
MTADRMHVDPDRALALLAGDGRTDAERRRLVELMGCLAELPLPPDAARLFPHYKALRAAFVEEALQGSDGELLEERFLELYAHLHMHEAPYTSEERQTMDAAGGYWSHAGGLAPILKAGDWIRPDTVSADLGAGNGLQALLMQRLFPHRSSVQIEISSAMVEIGRQLQTWLEIPVDRVQWRVADVLATPLGGWSFVYLYRPVRPCGPGESFYLQLGRALTSEPGEVVIFSIADCLREFLPEVFVSFYDDGHLTCYRKEASKQRARRPTAGLDCS